MDNKAPARYDGPNHPALDDMVDFYGLDLEHTGQDQAPAIVTQPGPLGPLEDQAAPMSRIAQAHAAEIARCLCGHALTAHEHYRRGSDCGICGCPEARPA